MIHFFWDQNEKIVGKKNRKIEASSPPHQQAMNYKNKNSNSGV